MSAIPLSGDMAQDGDVLGVTAISNDGSQIYFVADGVLATNTAAQGARRQRSRTCTSTTRRRPSNPTTFIATLSQNDVQSCCRIAWPTDLEPC